MIYISLKLTFRGLPLGRPLPCRLRLSNRFGVHVSSILRGHQRPNIPGGDSIVFPGDRLQVIGSDARLAALHAAVVGETVPADPDIEKREMRLAQIVIDKHSPFVGRTMAETGIRERFSCMVVGRGRRQGEPLNGVAKLPFPSWRHCLDCGRAGGCEAFE